MLPVPTALHHPGCPCANCPQDVETQSLCAALVSYSGSWPHKRCAEPRNSLPTPQCLSAALIHAHARQIPQRGRLRDISVPSECPAVIEALIWKMMDHVPINRPTAKQIVALLGSMRDNEDERGRRGMRMSAPA